MAWSLKQRVLLPVMVVLLLLRTSPSIAELQKLKHTPTKADQPLNILVVGDWGRKGTHNQSLVAYQMGEVGEKHNIDFVISTGDNFYDDGLTGVDDPAFYDSFVNIYTAQSLQKIWYNVLGNHDYRGDVEAQLSPILTQKDSRWVCMRSFILDAGIVEFFFVDTTPFRDDYFTDPEDHTYDWSGVLPREAYLSGLLEVDYYHAYMSRQVMDVDFALGQSKAKWKIVVGHHTIKSAGHHGNTVEVEQQFLPILKARNVDAYINGHDHCLEHIVDAESGIHFLTSGGGSKAWKGDIKPWDQEELKLYYDGQGFMTLQITESKADIVFYDIYGKVLHTWSLSKKLNHAASI
ncbi:hypothetical protein Ahy_B03g061944 isoform A [Arachis hypogaea]|uniref:Purple acid phosphatase n=1 Tax=Arachis hypogaea TaxID=3818 RepID=A0A444ZSG5_ARAHY|nr:hypothetical protein Ahy_B03g061944 isoform A [Arachis hypogaea]